MKNTVIRFLVMAFIVMTAQSALAYDKAGHQKIEKWAYKLLEAMPNGVAIKNKLISYGYLDTDYPEQHSSYPDLSLERQFAQNKQMYHFMAANADVLAACKAQDPEHALLMKSLPACLKMMYFFFRETVSEPVAARQSGRGLYVLMHIVGDSYSGEHTTRDQATQQLITIKGWRLSRTNWPPIAKDSIANTKLLRLLHHGIKSPGDHDYLPDDSTRLPPQPTMAARAIADLLVAVYKAQENPAHTDDYINDFFSRYFRPYGSTIGANDFVFAATGEKIVFNYAADFTATPEYTMFGYDRFPAKILTVGAGYNFQGAHPSAVYSLNYEIFVAPYSTDNSQAFVKRLPRIIGLSLAKYTPSATDSWKESLQARAWLKTSFSLPVIVFDPYVGAGVSLLGGHRPGLISGFDIPFELLNDPDAKYFMGIRLSVGYEHNFSGFPVSNTVGVKLGGHFWNSRGKRH